MKFCVIFLITIKLICAEVPRPEIKIPSGTLRGAFQYAENGRKFAAFEGIPYARPPLGDLRFQPPQPIKSWPGVWEANFLHTCIQFAHYIEPGKDRVVGNEDCLYLNLYTPQLNPGALLDVIVHIHGGAFMFGFGHGYGPKILLSRDVVYVNINYRLGPLGFLSTEDNVVPGNMGMKDQVMAMQWIKNNIIYFGGNPDSITLTGLSAGGASVHLHYMSPMSVGLFHRGFSMSGAALNSWVMVENSLDKAKRLAFSLGCRTRSNKEMINCMRSRPSRQLVQNVDEFLGFLFNPFPPFGVVVEPTPRRGKKAFLTEHPYQILKKGKIQQLPWLTSTVQAEGLYPAAEFLSKPEYIPQISERYYEIAPYLLDYNYTIIETENTTKTNVSAQCLKEYFQNRSISRDTYNELVQMMGDRLFQVDCDLAARLHANVSKESVYFYYFSYRGAHSRSETLAKIEEDVGVSHGDDTMYALQTSTKSRSTEKDIQMSEEFLDLWTSFAKTGVPKILNATWSTVGRNTCDPLKYINIISPMEVKEITNDDFGRSKFWLSLPIRENKKLFPELSGTVCANDWYNNSVHEELK